LVLGIWKGEPKTKKSHRKLLKELWPTQGCYVADDDDGNGDDDDELAELMRVNLMLRILTGNLGI
jgi:hypothetical protein